MTDQSCRRRRAATADQLGIRPQFDGVGYIAKTAYVAAASLVEALADGSLTDADVGVAEALRLTPGEIGCPPAGE